ncbi:hypothetical protein GCM10022419_096700 [Nonomuraea rosea]|uniref:Xylulose 5-phosphate/Fructose 6-phosphate phosphoketolase C-terminal domain-containing protein n=1 Tax=Nonomuraea rosea TaxID=638574 RepID=A0ABP6Z4P0_9ACTN
MRRLVPDLRVRVVNVVDLMRLFPVEHHPHGTTDKEFVELFTEDKPSYDGLLDRVIKIVGVSDDHDLVARCEADVQARFSAHVSAARSQPYYLDVTHPTANKGVVVERLSRFYRIPLDQIVTRRPAERRADVRAQRHEHRHGQRRPTTVITRCPARGSPGSPRPRGRD